MQISKITRRSAIALSVAAALTLAGCGDKEPAKSELVPVGIVQLVEHSALDACTKGVKDALAERGYKDGVNIKIDFQNAQGDQSNLHNIATRFVSNKDKLIFAVATPAAQAVATTAKGTPIVATAITDFVVSRPVTPPASEPATSARTKAAGRPSPAVMAVAATAAPNGNEPSTDRSAMSRIRKVRKTPSARTDH